MKERVNKFIAVLGNLAKINELGLLTWMSQDALEDVSEDVQHHERAYVCGVMPRELTKIFVTKFNVSSNCMFATMSIALPREKLGRNVRMGITNRSVDRATGEWKIRGVAPGVTDERMIQHMNREYEEGFLAEVDVIDPEWGRPATSKKGLWSAVIKILTEMNK